MRQTTDGLIIRENNNLGESDRFVTVLTRDLGVVHASVRGARNIKNPRSSATRLLSYSRLTLFCGRETYIVDEAEPLGGFFAVSTDVTKLSLAQYFCELAGVMAPREEPAEPFLRLLLNALHFLIHDTYDPRHIKTVAEVRLLCLSGYMPRLTDCHQCHTEDAARLQWLSPSGGVLTCGDCPHPADSRPLSPTLLAALRHIAYAPFEKCFSFSLPEAALSPLSSLAEALLLSQLGRGFKTLDFYHTVEILP